jgi:hypothetical protein
LWARATARAEGKQLRAVMDSLRLVEATPGRILVACDGPMRRMAEVRLAEVEGIVKQFSPSARVELAPEAGQSGPSGPGEGVASGAPVARPAMQEPEIVRLAAELFGARVVNVQRKDRT